MRVFLYSCAYLRAQRAQGRAAAEGVAGVGPAAAAPEAQTSVTLPMNSAGVYAG